MPPFRNNTISLITAVVLATSSVKGAETFDGTPLIEIPQTDAEWLASWLPPEAVENLLQAPGDPTFPSVFPLAEDEAAAWDGWAAPLAARGMLEVPERDLKQLVTRSAPALRPSNLVAVNPSQQIASGLGRRLQGQVTGVGESVAPLHGGFGGYAAVRPMDERPLEYGLLSAGLSLTSAIEGFSRKNAGMGSYSGGLFSTGLAIDGTVALSETNHFDFTIGAGFDYLMDSRSEGSRFDLNIVPESRVGLAFGVGNWQFEIYDRFSIQRNRQRAYFTLDAIDSADIWSNALGVTAALPLNESLSFKVGYEYQVLRTMADAFAAVDRDEQTVFSEIRYSPKQTWAIGIDTSYSIVTYDSAIRNDGEVGSLGGFLELPFSDYTQLRLAIGWENGDFDAPMTAIADRSNFGGLYYSLSISNQLNEAFSHSFGVGRSVDIGYTSNYIVSDYLRYGLAWDVADGTRINGAVSVSRFDESGGSIPEDALVYGANVGVSQVLTDYTSLGISVDYNTYHSELGGRDHDQQRYQAWCRFKLNENLTAHLSFQHWRGNGNAGIASFQENRLLLGASYQF